MGIRFLRVKVGSFRNFYFYVLNLLFCMYGYFASRYVWALWACSDPESHEVVGWIPWDWSEPLVVVSYSVDGSDLT